MVHYLDLVLTGVIIPLIALLGPTSMSGATLVGIITFKQHVLVTFLLLFVFEGRRHAIGWLVVLDSSESTSR